MMLEIDKHVMKMFSEHRSEFKTVHDLDLRRWALQKAAEFPNIRKNFKGSGVWVNEFKKKHRISSRKITKIVSKRQLINEDQVMSDAEAFRQNIRRIQNQYSLENIWNTDQIGFAYEYINQRTLSWKGENVTFAAGFAPKNSATHSYTVQYIINAAGQIVGNVFLCLLESSNNFGIRVKETMFKAPNVTVCCTKSGKLNTVQVE